MGYNLVHKTNKSEFEVMSNLNYFKQDEDSDDTLVGIITPEYKAKIASEAYRIKLSHELPIVKTEKQLNEIRDSVLDNLSPTSEEYRAVLECTEHVREKRELINISNNRLEHILSLECRDYCVDDVYKDSSILRYINTRLYCTKVVIDDSMNMNSLFGFSESIINRMNTVVSTDETVTLGVFKSVLSLYSKHLQGDEKAFIHLLCSVSHMEDIVKELYLELFENPALTGDSLFDRLHRVNWLHGYLVRLSNTILKTYCELNKNLDCLFISDSICYVAGNRNDIDGSQFIVTGKGLPTIVKLKVLED